MIQTLLTSDYHKKPPLDGDGDGEQRAEYTRVGNIPNNESYNKIQYIILKDGILRFNSFNITSKRGLYFTVHSLGRYGLFIDETYEGIIIFMTVKMIYCPY